MRRDSGNSGGKGLGDFARSPLWVKGFLHGSRGRLREQASSFEQELLNLRGKVALLVSSVPKDIPGLTVHDITHLDALWETASLICGEKLPLNPAEAYVLGAGILFHDAGMTIASYTGGVKEIESTDEWRDALRVCLEEERNQDPNCTHDSGPSAKVKKLVLARVLRALHAKHAGDLPFSQWTDHDGQPGEFLIDSTDLRNFYGSLIGKVAKSHHLDVQELPSALGNEVGALTSAPANWTVDPLKVACILRVADVAHIDERRAPRFLYLLSKLEGLSAIHWNFQSKIAKARLEGDAVVFTSGPDFGLNDADAWWLCYNTVQGVDRELREVDLLLEKLKRPRFAGRRVLGAESPSSFCGYVRTSSWLPVDTHVRVSDIPKIVKMFGGSHLYGDDPVIAIRELIQNASDAVRARGLVQDRPKNSKQLSVRLVERNDGWWLEVEDNGVGMSRDTLTKVLLDFGKSFWSGEAVTREFPGLLAKGMSATGRFGIGFFSVFMLGDLVKVTSRRFDASAKSTLVLEFRSGLELQPILRRAGRTEILGDGGTVVSVRLSQGPYGKKGLLARETWGGEIEKLNLKSLVGSICPNIDVNVSVGVNGRNSRCISADDWKRIKGDRLLRRISGTDYSEVGYDKANEIYAANVRHLADEDGMVYGRACILGTNHFLSTLEGVTTVGGLKAERVSNIAGILCARTESIKRDTAIPTVPHETLGIWATEQANLVAASKLSPGEKLRIASVVLSCGGEVGTLPIAVRNGGHVGYNEVKELLNSKEEIIVFEGEEVEYDEDLDNCHPREFNLSFQPEENLFFVWNPNSAILRIGNKQWPGEFLGKAAGTLRDLFYTAVCDAWRSEPEEQVEERVVGQVDFDEICRDVKVYRRT